MACSIMQSSSRGLTSSLLSRSLTISSASFTSFIRPTLNRRRSHVNRHNSNGLTSRSISSGPARNAQSIADKLKGAVQDGLSGLKHASSQYEGAQEGGLRVLIFGKPGSGKGTLSARLVQKYDLNFISTGDVLRREILNGTDVGKECESVVASGGLVSDELMLKVIETELDKMHGKSWLLDGFPRTLRQAGLLDSALNEQGRPLNMIIHLAVPDVVIMKRISARWVHLPSGRVYNTEFSSSAPKVAGRDDVTGELLTKRPDDNPQVIAKRLKAFYDSTSPLLDFFQDRYPGALHNLHGSTSDEVRVASSSPLPPGFSYNAPDSNPDLTLAAAPSDNITGVEKIWPQLQAIIDPYRIHRKDRTKTPEEVKDVRREADDLKEQ